MIREPSKLKSESDQREKGFYEDCSKLRAHLGKIFKVSNSLPQDMAKALIVIDMLRGYMKNTDDPRKIIRNQIKLIEAFKKKNCKVILALPDFESGYKNPVMIRLWGEEFKDDPEGKKLVPELEQFKFDKIVKKKEYSAFYRTDLERYCKNSKIGELYFTGVYCGACIFFSAVDAAYRQIQPYMVIDATGCPKKSLVGINSEKETYKRFKLMIGLLIKTNKLIEQISGK